MLSQNENVEFLVDSDKEMDEILKVFPLNEQQKHMIRSLRKQPGAYTEGLMVSTNITGINGLFRNIPMRLVLALGQTDPNEKAHRRKMMKKHGLNELETVYKIADDMVAAVRNKA